MAVLSLDVVLLVARHLLGIGAIFEPLPTPESAGQRAPSSS